MSQVAYLQCCKECCVGNELIPAALGQSVEPHAAHAADKPASLQRRDLPIPAGLPEQLLRSLCGPGGSACCVLLEHAAPAWQIWCNLKLVGKVPLLEEQC